METEPNDAPSGASFTASFTNICALGETDRDGLIICKFHTIDEIYCGYVGRDVENTQKKCHKYIKRGVR